MYPPFSDLVSLSKIPFFYFSYLLSLINYLLFVTCLLFLIYYSTCNRYMEDLGSIDYLTPSLIDLEAV